MDFLVSDSMKVVAIFLTYALFALIVWSVSKSWRRSFKIKNNVRGMQAELTRSEWEKERDKNRKHIKIFVICSIIIGALLIYPIVVYNPLFELSQYIHSVYN